MKAMKKILTVLLAAALVGAMATTALAAADDQIVTTVAAVETEDTDEIRAEHIAFTYDRSGNGLSIRTNSQSDTVAIRIQGGTAATDETDGLSLENGTVTISKELADKILADGENTLHLIFSDGVLEVTVFVTDESLSEPIQAEHTTINYGKNGDGFSIRTNSQSDTVAIRIQGGTAATDETDGLSIENGTVTLSKELADKILADGENTLHLIFSDGVLEVTVFVTDESLSEPIQAEHTTINYGKNGDGFSIRTNSQSDTVAIRIQGGTAATDETDGLSIENGTVTISKELADKILVDGENTLHLIFSDGVLEVTVFVTNDSEPIQAEHTTINYGKNGDGFSIRTNSQSDTVAIRIQGGTAATDETDGLSLENGTVTISKELADKILVDGENTLHLIFSDGVLEVTVFVTDDEPIQAEHTTINYGKNGDGFSIRTNSQSDTVAIRIQGGTAATDETDGLSIENGTVTLSKELADKILVDGENSLHLIFSDGVLEVTVFVTNDSEPIQAEHTTINYGKNGDGFSIRTNSQSDTVAIRIQGGTAATDETDGLSIENGTVTLSKELADKILVDGENTLHLIFSDGVLEITVFVTDDSEPIQAEHTTINYGKNGDGFSIRTNSQSDTVAIRIQGGTAATDETDGLSIENGTVTLSKELADKILVDGENSLHLIFSDGVLEVTVFVTDEVSVVTPGINVPKTGDNSSAIALSLAVMSGLAGALYLSLRRRKDK